MSKWLYSGEATISMSTHDDEIALEFCDANVAQWKEPAGPASDCEDDAELAAMIADAIRDNADDLAESIVSSFRERVKEATDA